MPIGSVRGDGAETTLVGPIRMRGARVDGLMRLREVELWHTDCARQCGADPLPQAELHWLAESRDEIVGYAAVASACAPSTAELVVYVRPDCRERGVGSRLLDAALRLGHGRVQRWLLTTDSVASTGRRWAEYVGAVPFLEARCYQLPLSQCDVMQALRESQKRGCVEVELSANDAGCDERWVDGVSALKNEVRQLYTPSALGAGVEWRREQQRASEQALSAMGASTWVTVAATGSEVIGFHEAVWMPTERDVLYEGDVAVRRQWVGRGIASTLRQETLRRALLGTPPKSKLRYLRVTNVRGDESMTSTNQRLGFERAYEYVRWCASHEDVVKVTGRPTS